MKNNQKKINLTKYIQKIKKNQIYKTKDIDYTRS